MFCKQVIRSAEECAQTVARYFSQDECMRLLTTIITDPENPMAMSAVKMQTQVIKVAPRELVEIGLRDLIPGLIQVRLIPHLFHAM